MADVSVIIPCFNGSAVLSRALASVAEQSDPPREVLVVDDGSLDVATTRVVAAAFAHRVAIRLFCLATNRGAAAARNLGLANAQGKYAAFLDADDVWHREKIAVQYGMMQQHELTISGHGYVPRVVSLDDLPAVQSAPTVRRVGIGAFVARNRYFTPTVMILRAGFRGFDERLRRADDYKAWILAVSEENARAAYIEANLAAGFKRAIGSAGLSASLEGLHSAHLAALRSLRAESTRISRPFVLCGIGVEHLKYPLRRAKVALIAAWDRRRGHEHVPAQEALSAPMGSEAGEFSAEVDAAALDAPGHGPAVSASVRDER